MRYLLLYFSVMTFNMYFKCVLILVFLSFLPKIDHGSVAPSGDRDRRHCFYTKYLSSDPRYLSLATIFMQQFTVKNISYLCVNFKLVLSVLSCCHLSLSSVSSRTILQLIELVLGTYVLDIVFES